ncbi:porin [Mesorhizobium amorphae]|uniref:porin n=1 Tax=Mesorhizobium amorphae TaxID=71433 RepID=UPI0011852040|nr:porin [Mesorhizobium amorphae]
MKKSILSAVLAVPALGFNGAYAADPAVVAEPEPAEFVKICDVYGAGFFYIPGTETCLRIGGYVRYDIGFGENLGSDVDGDGLGDTYYKRARFSLQTDARSQTELGTLRAYAKINFDRDTNGSIWNYNSFGSPVGDNIYINDIYVELGGFRIGMTDSVFTTLTDYAGNVINDWLLGYGPFRTNQISYTYTGGNGFAATVALEQGAGSYTIDNYVPHVVFGGSYTQGWGKVSAVGAYDSVNEVWAGKARLDIKATDAISLFVMAGYKSDKNIQNYYGNWGGSWAVWGGGTAKVNDKTSLNLQVAYDDSKAFAAVANVSYAVVPGFYVTPEVVYTSKLDYITNGKGSLGGFIRFERNF